MRILTSLASEVFNVSNAAFDDFGGDDNYNSAEELRSAGHECQNALIPKPPGQAGCLSRGGYSLERSLNWERVELSSVQVS